MSWQAQVITLLPRVFPGLLGESLAGKALREGVWALDVVDLRQFGQGKHKAIDDTPFGGGAGMVLRADVAASALGAARERVSKKIPVLAMSARGAPLTQARVKALAAGAGLCLFCARFEGVDERFFEANGVEEVSIGDYVLSGGEAAAQVVLDAAVRLLPGVMGAAESGVEESFAGGFFLEYPHYTRPAVWEGFEVPQVLLSGDHKKIAAWRRAQGETATRARRPDLLHETFHLSVGVRDVDVAAAFFKKIFGAEVTHRDPSGYANLDFYGTQLTLQHLPDLPPRFAEKLPKVHFGVNLPPERFAALLKHIEASHADCLVGAAHKVSDDAAADRRKFYVREPTTGWLIEVKVFL